MLAGLKLIETLSFIQLDEFYLHQWMFVFDYFGLKIDPVKEIKEIKEVKNMKDRDRNDQISPFHF
jgi:hypothetical protein